MSEQSIPVLGEHQSHQAGSTNPTEYTPTEAEKNTLKLVQKLFEKAKNHRKKYDEKWMDYYKMFRGKQWKEQRPSYRHSEVINMIFQNIQASVPLMTDSRPKFDFLPQEPMDRELAEILSEVSEADWQKNNWLMQLTEGILDGHLYGIGIFCVDYDSKKKYGSGDIDFKSADPFYFFPDPRARDVNLRSRYCIYAEPEDVATLKREHPDKKDFIKADLIELVQGDKTDLTQSKFLSPVDANTVLEGSSTYDLGSKDQALKITCYILDDDFDEEEKKSIGEDGVEKTEYVQKLKYPKGRKIVIGGGVVLSDGAVPYDDGKFPYARFVNYILPREFYGISEVEQLESPQRIFNKLLSYALDVLTLMGNPIWVVDNTSGVDTDNLFNCPGLIVEKDPNSEVRREEGVQLQPYVLQLTDRMVEWFNKIGGETDTSAGVKPEGVTAASAITALQEAARTRIRQKSRNLDACLQDVGQLYLSRVMQFRTAPEIYRLTNNQNVNKYFKFHVETLKDEQGNDVLDERGDPKRVAHVQKYSESPTGQMMPGLSKPYPINGSFDVRVTTGSALPFAKTEKINTAKMLFDAGAIDEMELLKAADYPNWEAVHDRMQAKKEQEAQMAAAAQGGGAPPQVA